MFHTFTDRIMGVFGSLPSTAMVFPCRGGTIESRASSPLTDAQAPSPPPTSRPPRAVYWQKFQETLLILCLLVWLGCVLKQALVAQHHMPLKLLETVGCLFDWFLRVWSMPAWASVCACVWFFICVVRIRRAAFSQESCMNTVSSKCGPGPCN